MRNRLVHGMMLCGLLVTGCVTASPADETPTQAAAQAVGAAPLVQRMITFVAYYDDAAHTNLVGAATFSECPGDPSYRWGAQTSYYTIESEPCG